MPLPQSGMPPALKAVYDSLPRLPQRQDSTDAQLRDLRDIASRLGLYDAADYLRIVLERKD